jgi:hypothetical protein
MDGPAFVGLINDASMGAFKTKDIYVYSNAIVVVPADRSATWVKVLSTQFGLLGALLFSGSLKRIHARRLARGQAGPDMLAAGHADARLIPVATIISAEISHGFLSVNLRLSLATGQIQSLSWPRVGTNHDAIHGWLRRALGTRLIDERPAAA